MMKKLILVPVLILCLSASVMANQAMHHSSVPAAGAESVLSPAGKEFEATMNRMHEPMMAAIHETDPDVAFVKGMIPHHVGAVEMAQTVLKYGKDPEIRKLAEEVIKAQEGEIKMMKDWLAVHDKKAQ